MADMWTVISQRQDTVLDENGPGFSNVWQVTFQVTSGPGAGTRGTVNIPASQFNADTVKAAITAAVYHIDQVAGL